MKMDNDHDFYAFPFRFYLKKARFFLFSFNRSFHFRVIGDLAIKIDVPLFGTVLHVEILGFSSQLMNSMYFCVIFFNKTFIDNYKCSF